MKVILSESQKLLQYFKNIIKAERDYANLIRKNSNTITEFKGNYAGKRGEPYRALFSGIEQYEVGRAKKMELEVQNLQDDIEKTIERSHKDL